MFSEAGTNISSETNIDKKKIITAYSSLWVNVKLAKGSLTIHLMRRKAKCQNDQLVSHCFKNTAFRFTDLIFEFHRVTFLSVQNNYTKWSDIKTDDR